MKIGDRIKVRRGDNVGKIGEIVVEVLTDVDVSYPEGRTERCSKVELIVQFNGYWGAMNRLHLQPLGDGE